jgi:hypothetical protein
MYAPVVRARLRPPHPYARATSPGAVLPTLALFKIFFILGFPNHFLKFSIFGTQL